MTRYILGSDGAPVLCADPLTWADWFETSDRTRTIAVTEFAWGRVSTVFLGIDHDFEHTGVPVLWETMVFGGPHDGAQERYTSHDAAKAGHEAMLRTIRGTTSN